MRIIFYSIKGAGHVNPTLPIVRALVEAGHEVWYSVTEEWTEAIGERGATFLNCAGSGPFTTADHHPGAPFSFQLFPSAAALADRLVEEARALEPDVIVRDSICPWGLVVSTALGCPEVVSHSGLPMTDPAAGGIDPERVHADPKNVAAIASIEERFGLRLSWHGMESFHGAENLVYSAPMLSPDTGSLSGRYHFVGPTVAGVDAEAELAAAGLSQIGRERRLVYMALGTLAPRVLGLAPSFYRPFLDAVGARDDLELVLSTSRAFEPEDLAPVPANATVLPFAPQVAVLSRAAAFITHTGANSMHEGLFHDVPLVCVPCFAEQPFNAAVVERTGVGLRLDRASLDATVVGAALERVLGEPHFADSARAVGEELRGGGGVGAAIAIIEGASTAG